MGLLSAVGKIPGFGALSPLFMAADVMSTKVVNEMLNEFSETSLLAWEKAKQGGLNQALVYAQHSDGAKMLDLDYIPYISQEAHEEFLKGKITRYLDLLNYQPKEDSKNNYYCYFFYKKTENGRNKYLIDSIFLRE